MAIYDRAALASAVRNLLQNATQTTLPDSVLQTIIDQGKRHLDRDKPAEKTKLINATSSKWYVLNDLITDWQEGFSAVRGVINPAPNFLTNEAINRLEPTGYDFLEIEGQSRLFLLDGIPTNRQALVVYTTPWMIRDIDDADTTTLPQRYYNAVEFISAHIACLSMAAKSAGLSDNSIPTDFMNFRTKESEYRRVANEFKAQYLTTIGLTEGKEPGILVRAHYNLRDHYSRNRITH